MANDSVVLVQLKLLGASAFSAEGRAATATLKGLETQGAASGVGLARTGRGATVAESGLGRMNGAASKGGGALSTLKNAASGAFGMMTRLAGPVVALAGAFGFYSMVKGAIQFDQAMRSVNSILRLSDSQFQALEQQVNALAKTTYQAPTALAGGMRQLVEAGYNASQAMTILASSGKAAFAGQTDVTTATSTLINVLAAYHLSASDAAGVTDTLFRITERGPVTFTNLASSLGQVVAIASPANVSLGQVGAAIDTLSKQMGAQKAIMGLKNVMSGLLKPTANLQAAIDKTGYSSGTALLKAQGLQGALQLLYVAAGGTTAGMTKLFPGIRTVAAALGLTGKNAQTAKNDLKAFGDTSGATASAMAQMAKTPAGAWQHFKSTMQSLGNELALKVLPTITSVANALTDLFSGKGKVGKAASGFMSGLTKGVPPATGQAAPPIVGPMDAYGGHQLVTQQTMPNISQAQKVGAEVRKIFSDIGKALAPVAKAVGGVASSLVKAFKPLLPVLVPIGRILLTVFVVALQAAAVYFTVLGKVIGFVIKIIGGALKGVLTAFKAVWTGISWAVNAVSNGISWLWHNVLAPVGKFISGAFIVAITPLKLIWDGIKDAVNVLSGALSWLWHNVLAPLAAFIGGTLMAPFNALLGVINAVGNAAQSAFNWVSKALGSSGPTINPVNPITQTQAPSTGGTYYGGSGTPSGVPALPGMGSGPAQGHMLARFPANAAAAAPARLMSSQIVIQDHSRHHLYIDGREIHGVVYKHERRMAEAS